MPESSRGKAYLWVSWLSGYLSGDKHCEWALWYRANYRYEKRVDSNDDRLAQWAGEHADLVRLRAADLTANGWRVSVEDQNKFTINGMTVIVGGKPDLVAQKPGVFRVEDVKTGARKGSDVWQVLTYLTLLPLADESLVGLSQEGAVVYKDGEQPVRWLAENQSTRTISLNGSLDLESPDGSASRERILSRIRSVATTIAPARIPSEGECRFCDVACCPDRFVGLATVAATSAF